MESFISIFYKGWIISDNLLAIKQISTPPLNPLPCTHSVTLHNKVHNLSVPKETNKLEFSLETYRDCRILRIANYHWLLLWWTTILVPYVTITFTDRILSIDNKSSYSLITPFPQNSHEIGQHTINSYICPWYTGKLSLSINAVDKIYIYILHTIIIVIQKNVICSKMVDAQLDPCNKRVVNTRCDSPDINTSTAVSDNQTSEHCYQNRKCLKSHH